MTGTVSTPDLSDAPEQPRVLRVLAVAQILSGAGLAAGITVGALLARDMLGSTSLAGLPAMLFTVGSAGAAIGIGRLSQRLGRRVGLAAGYLTGAIGSAGVVLAAVNDNVPLLFTALVIYGAGTAANLQARYAGADLAAPHRRGRAVAIVLVATTVGAVAGPNLAGAMGRVAHTWGIPTLAGPFVLAGAAYAVGAAVLWTLLRPDPLVLARAREHDASARSPEPAPTPAAARTASKGIATGALVMIVAQMVMIAVMTMTPVHMQGHGHDVGAVGFVIGVHVAAMYLPSPLSGWLVDRWGAGTVAVLSAITFVAAGAVGAWSPPASVPLLVLSLALLGLGWSFGLVSGTAMVTSAAPLSQRARIQGNVDFLIALAGATGGVLSGVVVAGTSFATLALGGGVVALLLVPVLAVTRADHPRQHRPGTISAS
ncbi:MFS transporter [Demequina sp.]|uniref:MFS transporter n=1 Tax=Demequina sp. TaxID=2050685 RepID=UPI0025C4F21D|nr:MFS transporter [Demequina sp.]